MTRRGFSLIEMLAAAALSAVLMIGLLAVIAGVGRTRRAFAERTEQAAWSAGVADLLRTDLRNAQTIKVGANQLTLTGTGALDAQTLAPTHRPVRIEYSLQTAAGQSWLIRRQVDLDVLSTANSWSEPVCPGVASFAVEPIPDPLPAGAPKPPADAVPARVGITIGPASPNDPPLREVLIVR